MNQQEIDKYKESAKNVWGTTPAGTTFGQGHAKGTKEFFESVLKKRFTYECDWLDGIVNFAQFKDKKVLEVGCGAGYDAYMFCKNGADYTGIDIAPENIETTKKHLGHYGYNPTILQMDASSMLFDNEFDYIYSFGVLHHIPDMERALSKIHCALKKGGKAQIIVYNRNSIFYKLSLIFGVWFWAGKYKTMSLREVLQKIEYTESDKLPWVEVYSKKDLFKIFHKIGFFSMKFDIRKLVYEDIVAVPILGRVLKNFPKKFFDFLGKFFGWYVSVTAEKNRH